MSCHNCGSNRIADVTAKCSDMCGVEYDHREIDGYVPDNLGIGGGDYIGFMYCLNCGMIKPRYEGQFPISESDVDKAFGREEKTQEEDEVYYYESEVLNG